MLVTSYTYDDASRRTQVTDAAGTVTKTDYDDLGRNHRQDRGLRRR